MLPRHVLVGSLSALFWLTVASHARADAADDAGGAAPTKSSCTDNPQWFKQMRMCQGKKYQDPCGGNGTCWESTGCEGWPADAGPYTNLVCKTGGNDPPIGEEAGENDEGCATSPNSTALPFLGAPLGLAILLALRRKKRN
jgi:MYXO-CTERM domain-containing protein